MLMLRLTPKRRRYGPEQGTEERERVRLATRGGVPDKKRAGGERMSDNVRKSFGSTRKATQTGRAKKEQEEV